MIFYIDGLFNINISYYNNNIILNKQIINIKINFEHWMSM